MIKKLVALAFAALMGAIVAADVRQAMRKANPPLVPAQAGTQGEEPQPRELPSAADLSQGWWEKIPYVPPPCLVEAPVVPPRPAKKRAVK